MFQPKKYQKKDPQYIFDFIQQHPFATLVLKGEELLATHIPVLVKGSAQNYILYGHIARANEQYDFLKDDLEVLLIFHGAHDYVSSSWYENTDISTWDYSAVHVNAKLKLQTDEELEDSLSELVRTFEKGEKEPVLYNDIPKKMLQDHLPLITGFWLKPVKVKAIAKLHQGYADKDVDSVINHLEQRKNPVSAELSKDIKKEHGKHH